MTRPSLVRGWAVSGRRVRWLSTQAAHATCTVCLATSGQALWRAEHVSLLAHMQAAGMLAAKRADAFVPMRVPRTLTSISLWVDEGEEGRANATDHSDVRVAAPWPREERGDGGFSARDLLDPDAWIGVAPAPIETPPRRAAPSTQRHWDTLFVHCRTAATTSSATEAMAGCMAASLALLDRLHEACGERMAMGPLCVRD